MSQCLFCGKELPSTDVPPVSLSDTIRCSSRYECNASVEAQIEVKKKLSEKENTE